MQKYLCKLGFHKYVSLNMTACFTTTYTDKKWEIRHIVWYQQCSCCHKRKLKDNYKKEVIYSETKHAGIEWARLNWETYGNMYLGEGKTIKPTPPEPIKPKLKLLDGGKHD